ncbi:hypothetical protein D5F01_LYC21411 [Larimichthys crocea]|uniref:MHC class II-associated invariant chain/CLIP MHC II-interacting domain-containing protein n=1 Tax=Larimichthys crocea TaxID=215358 RepID=A0A6G0HNS0_LARCR|nr:hypothetical protein D5F01_LYC21411 [Larimichthys crocea]
MSDPETPNQPLLQAATNVPAAQRGSSSRAYKVAGFTLLACLLIAGQAMIAYFLLNQRNDIKSLEEQNSNLQAEMTRGRSVAVPMRTHMAMNALPVMDVSMDEDSSITDPEKPAPRQVTDCQLEAAGKKPVQVPGFRPSCDERGLYQPQQCFMTQWVCQPSQRKADPWISEKWTGLLPCSCHCWQDERGFDSA